MFLLKILCSLWLGGKKITAEANLHVVNFLDVTFDLNNGKFKPYRKPNDDPLYINRHSNHPPSIIKQLPTSINKRISALSADEQTFHESAPIYQNALRHSNFDHKLDYMKQASQKTRRNRQRNIIWFNPPFSKNVKTNIARNFLCLIDKHFPPNHKRHKIFKPGKQKILLDRGWDSNPRPSRLPGLVYTRLKLNNRYITFHEWNQTWETTTSTYKHLPD